MNANDFLYEDFEAEFDPMRYDRQARRSRKPKARHVPKVAQQEIVEELVDDTVGLEGGFQATVASPPLPVLYSSDLEATLASVDAAGGRIVKPIFSFPGGRRFHFADPAGNELAVWGE